AAWAADNLALTTGCPARHAQPLPRPRPGNPRPAGLQAARPAAGRRSGAGAGGGAEPGHRPLADPAAGARAGHRHAPRGAAAVQLRLGPGAPGARRPAGTVRIQSPGDDLAPLRLAL